MQASKVNSTMGEKRSIRNLEGLLSSRLESEEKIVGVDVLPLTAPGENYGSIMIRIDIYIKNERTKEERKLETVGKLMPESEKILKVFNSQVTYRHEYHFYATIVPVLDKFLKSKGISGGADFAAPFIGGRLNIDNSESITSDAIILMENLKSAGLIIGGTKAEGVNLETAKVIFSSLAKFHAAGIALRHYEPQTFEEKLRPYFYSFAPVDDLYNGILTVVVEKIKDKGFTPEEVDVVRGYINKNHLRKTNISKTWGTMIHYDSWTNNFLIKYENNKPVHAIMVDLQMIEYGSPLNDVTHFLFTSVRPENFEESIDQLLDHYYEKILEYLKILGLDTNLFTKSSFEEEVKNAVRYFEYAHALWMLYPLMYEAFKSVDTGPEILTDWTEQHVQKLVTLTRICFKKGWLSVK